GQLYIDGEWTTGSGGGTFETLDPSTGSVIGTAIEASAADVDAAVDAAVRAFADPAWRDMTPSARGQLVRRSADLSELQADELGGLESRDVGQVVGVARGSMAGAADMFRYFAGWTTTLGGPVSSISVPGYLHYTRREPVG